MKEYRLKIIGVEDFVIISPKVLGLLLKKLMKRIIGQWKYQLSLSCHQDIHNIYLM